MTDAIRVFVNERPVTVARGATVRDAVSALDRDLGDLLAPGGPGGGGAYVTDGVGRPVDAGAAVGEAGAVYRVVVSAARSGGKGGGQASARRSCAAGPRSSCTCTWMDAFARRQCSTWRAGTA